MVLGIIGIVLSVLGFSCPAMNVFRWVAVSGVSGDKHFGGGFEQFLWFMFLYLLGIGFSIWLMVIAIGLISFKKWSRRWAVLYGYVNIAWYFIAWCINVLMMFLGCVEKPSDWPLFIYGISLGLLGMIYPVLLLIFMKTEKVKLAFAAVEGEFNVDELNLGQAQISPQIAEKPMSIIVFGILNITFALLGPVFAPCILPVSGGIIRKTMEPTAEYMIWSNTCFVLGLGFAIWLLITGIGLLMMKRWARKGLVIYSIVAVLSFILSAGMNIAALVLHWITMFQHEMTGYIIGLCLASIGGLIYPILLLIFMQSAKVKKAFGE
jgi:hypothetical protein